MYFINNGGKSEGPFSFEEMQEKNLVANTLIWKKDWNFWKPVSEVAEFSEFLSNLPPPLPINNEGVEAEHSTFQLNTVASLSGITCIIGVAILILIMPDFAGTLLGVALITAFSVYIWYKFNNSFTIESDKWTIRASYGIIASYILFFSAYLYAWLTDWTILVGTSLIELLIFIFSPDKSGGFENTQALTESIYVVYFTIVLGFSILIVSFIRLIFVRKRYGIQLGRIGLSALLMVPVLYLNLISQGILGGKPLGPIMGILVLTPYIFIIQYFSKKIKKT